MDSGGWRASPGESTTPDSSADWRSHVQADFRRGMLSRVIDAIKSQQSSLAPENQSTIRDAVAQFEEKIYKGATSQNDYVAKLLDMAKSQNTGVSNQNPTETASYGMQSQVHNHGETQVSLANQSQAHQQLLPQNIIDSSASGIRSSGNLSPVIPSVSGLTPSSMSLAQNSVGQSFPSNIYSNPQRQMQARQHQQLVVSQQSQQMPSNTLQYMYQPHQNQILKQKLQQGSMQSSRMQSQIQPQQNLLQSSQQSLIHVTSSLQPNHSTSQQMQSSGMQSTSLTGFQQNQQSPAQPSTPTALQQHAPSVLSQQQQLQQSLHQQSPGLHQQQSFIPQQQQQMVVGQKQSTMNIQQNQLLSPKHSISDLQQSQQQLPKQTLLGKQSTLSNMHQQHLLNVNQHQLGSQSSVGLQQQQLVGSQSGVSSMQLHQPSFNMLSQVKAVGQRIPGQQSQSQSQSQTLQQQLLPQFQTQSGQFQQQLGLQRQRNPMQQDVQKRLNSSGVPPQNVIEQKQIQSPRMLPEVLSASMDSTSQLGHGNTADFQEEVYQKIQAIKETYSNELSSIRARLLHLEQEPQRINREQLEKLKMSKVYLERIQQFLELPKNDITPFHRDKLPSYEKQIADYVNGNKVKKPIPSNKEQQKLQSPGGQTLSMMQQQPLSQIPKLQHIDNQLQSMCSPNTAASVQPSPRSSMSLGSLSLAAHMGVLPTQTNAMNMLQSSSKIEMAQGSPVPSLLQQGGMGSRLQNTLSGPQHGNVNAVSQNGANMTSFQLTPNMFQQQHTKQQSEQQLLQSPQFKYQFNQRQMQLYHQQQKQQLQQNKSQQSAQFHAHQTPQLQQMSEDLRMRQSITLKAGMTSQQQSSGQRMPYHHQHLRPGVQFPITSQLLTSAASPQTSQQSSPQIDQQNMITSLSKAATPLQSANSPLIVPSPSTPLTPSPIPGEPEKQVSSVSPLQNAGNNQTSMTPTQVQSLAIGTPGISASPLLADFISIDGNQATEQPLERLVKAVKSISQKAFSAAANDIEAIISMADMIADSPQGNGSRAMVGEELAAMTKCRVRARDFVTQARSTTAKRMRRDTTAIPVNTVSSALSANDSVNQSANMEKADLVSTATSRIRRPKFEANHDLLEEIKEINQRLIDTVVEIDEDVDPATLAAAAQGGNGAVVKCSYAAVALSPNLKKQYASGQMPQILPLQLFVPANYPDDSPKLLDHVPTNLSMDCEDMSVKARLRFSTSLRCLSQPMSLKEMVRTWDACTRAVMTEYAKQRGGGTFSTRYGTWENCVVAS